MREEGEKGKRAGSQATFAEINGGRLGERRDKPHTTHGVCICFGLVVRYSSARRANRELLVLQRGAARVLTVISLTFTHRALPSVQVGGHG